MHAVVVGLGFGDESKGATVDQLVRSARNPTVVRFSGGAQCGHGVVTPSGKGHVFHQFGAGTLTGAPTFLSRHVLVNPVTLYRESLALQVHGIGTPLRLVSVDREALVTTVYHVAANRIAEMLRGDGRHGSCGMGIGETVADSIAYPGMALRVGDLSDPTVLRAKLTFSHALKHARVRTSDLNTDDPACQVVLDSDVEHQVERYARLGKMLNLVDRDHLRQLNQAGDLIFEGAQGVLLDQDFGFHPHTTWANTTFDNALELLNEAGIDSAEVRRIGVLRAYHTRHGAGPFPTEDPVGIAGDTDNVTNVYQQSFRRGPFDAVLARYARRVVGRLDELVVTNLDKIEARPRACTDYQLRGELIHDLPVQKTRPTNLAHQERLTHDLNQARPVYHQLDSKRELVAAIQSVLETPVTWCSVGPTVNDRIPGGEYLRGGE